MTDRSLGGRYTLLEKIGEGGMSIVYCAKDTLLNRTVAVKILRDQYAGDTEFKERFRREAQNAAGLSHPNIVNVYDVGEDSECNYIVMELVKGEPLNEIIKREGQMDVEKATTIVVQVLDALAVAHANGVIHRDIKPHNILVSEDGHAKVADFGIARAASSSDLTETGTVVGTVNYTSPEQAKGLPATGQSDLYSLGIVMYEMLTGTLPFSADTPVGVAMKHVSEKPQMPRELNPKLPKDLERVIMKALQKRPEDRWHDAREFKRAVMRTSVGNKIAQTHSELNVSDVDERDDHNNLTKKFSVATGEADTLGRDKGPRKPKPKRDKVSVAIWAIIFSVIVLVSLTAFFGYRAFKEWISVEEVTVPGVVGLSLNDAQRVLGNSKLRIDSISRVYDPEVEVNYVISQTPEQGEKKKANATVDLIVSLGQEMTTVPDLTGMTVRQAKFELEKAELVLGTTERDFHEEIPVDSIMLQVPEAGESIAKGSTIDITLSDGPEIIWVKAPLVVGMKLEDATRELEAQGFRVGNVVNKFNLFYEAGKVTEQTPGPDEDVQVGSFVDLVVATKSFSSGENSGSAGSSSDPDVTRKFDVSYDLIDGPDVQEILVVVHDVYGERTVYGPRSHRLGDTVKASVDVHGNGRVDVLVDGAVAQTYNVP